MKVLVVDVGGTHVKVLVSGQSESRQFDSGPALIPSRMVHGVQEIAGDWSYDAVSIGYPGQFFAIGRSLSRTTWDVVGSVSISKLLSDVPSS